MSIPAVLVYKPTGKILGFRNYPNADGSPIIGANPDEEYLIINTPFPSPDYDPRVYILDNIEPDTEVIVAAGEFDLIEEHPEYPGVKQYKKTFDTTRRTDDQINLAIDNAEESANKELTDYRTNEKLFMLGLGVLTRKSEGILPSVEEEAILAKVKDFDVKIWKNDAEKKLKKGQVAAGQVPDIDAGWERGTSPII